LLNGSLLSHYGTFLSAAGNKAALVSFHAIRPHFSQQSNVPGYTLPAFLRNNFAKGWVRPDKTQESSSPFGTALNKFATLNVMEFLTIESKNNFRAASVGADSFVRKYYIMELEDAYAYKSYIITDHGSSTDSVNISDDFGHKWKRYRERLNSFDF
jgi:hypothetical protein